jgi:hypothetical protein
MNNRIRNRLSKWSLIGLIGAAAVAPAAGGRWFSRRETRHIRSEQQSQLKAVAEMKAKQIGLWRKDRLNDARINSTGIIRSHLLFTALCMLLPSAIAGVAFGFRQKTLYRNACRAEQERRQVEQESQIIQKVRQ